MLSVIGLAGPARSGKDTVAGLLKYYVKGYQYAFADPIRQAMKAAFGLENIHMDGTLKEVPLKWMNGRSPRYLMQTFGTEYGRELVDENVWIKVAERNRIGKRGIMIVSDVRFENEAEWVREHGILIHIERPNVQEVRAHVSESGILRNPGERTIENDGDLDQLRLVVRKLAEELTNG